MFKILLFLISVIPLTFALRCYVCNSAYDKDCDAKSIPEKYLVECSKSSARSLNQSISSSESNYTTEANVTNQSIIISPIEENFINENITFTVCRKDDAWIPKQNNGKRYKKDATRRIVRSCGWLGPTNKACKLLANQFLTQCTCSEDACNISQQLSISKILAILTLCVSSYFLV